MHVLEGKPPLMGNQPTSAAKMGQRNGGGGGQRNGGGGGQSVPLSPTSPIVSNGPLTRKTTIVRQGNSSNSRTFFELEQF